MILLWPAEGVISKSKGNLNKCFARLCLVCCFHMFYCKLGPRGSGGYDDKSWGGFCCFLIVLISPMAVNVVISAAGRCPAAAGEQEQKQMEKTVTSVFA